MLFMSARKEKKLVAHGLYLKVREEISFPVGQFRSAVIKKARMSLLTLCYYTFK